MPYVEKLYSKSAEKWDYSFDFRHEKVCSIVLSGHKWIGSPWPTGIYVMRKNLMVDSQYISYTGTTDSTLGGSRNALSPLVFWNYLAG